MTLRLSRLGMLWGSGKRIMDVTIQAIIIWRFAGERE